MYINQLTLKGFITKPVEVKESKTGVPYANFEIVVGSYIFPIFVYGDETAKLALIETKCEATIEGSLYMNKRVSKQGDEFSTISISAKTINITTSQNLDYDNYDESLPF